MSPSALDSWHNSRSNFIKSYFEGIRTPDTPAMIAGKKVHTLIEAGIVPAKKVYDLHEVKIEIKIKEGYVFLGIPDSRGERMQKGVVEFVDYKTGKANAWKEKLPVDIKMRATAWLVWKATGEPKKVIGHIEYIPTEWDSVAKEVVPIADAESEIISLTYTAEELQDFTKIIVDSMDEVNEEYDKWLESTGQFINKEDLERYVELRKAKDELEVLLKDVGDRLMSQMEFGAKKTHQTPFGTLFITERKTYEYPKGLRINYLDMGLTIEDAEAITMASKAAQKNYELTADPKTTSKSMGFRPTKK